MKHITLKSLIYTLFCISILASCQNEAIEIQKQVEVTISPSKVLESFIPYNSENLEMAEDEDLGTARLRITVLVYDSEGELYVHNEGLLNDYNSDYSFDILIDPNEEYKLLAFSSSIHGSLENITHESYFFDGINSLNSLEVTQSDAYSWSSNYSVLGILDEELNAGMGNTKLYLAPATALVYLDWVNIHSLHDIASNSIYGDYSASAVDFYDNYYTWDITLSPGEEDGEVIIHNFSAVLSDLGLTSDQDVNIYNGYISGDRLIIPTGQNTGAVDSEIYDLFLMGVNNDTYEEEDIVIYIDAVNKSLILENMFGTWSEKNGGGFYELFAPGLLFTSRTAGAFEYDQYRIIYHNNDVVKYKNNGFIYTSTLDNISNNGYGITPSKYPNSDSVYSFINLLPGTFDVFARTFIGNERADYSMQAVSVEAGEQYVFKFDCANLKLGIFNGQLKSTLLSFEEYSLYSSARRKIARNNYHHNGKLSIAKLDF